MDIGWLQRDFGIYVVNMFDTGQAARVLNYGKYSLAFLLKKFCDVTANKQYQLADWRIRSSAFFMLFHFSSVLLLSQMPLATTPVGRLVVGSLVM